MSVARAYGLFEVELARKVLLSPHMARLTFAGPAVRGMRTLAADQRIKVFFPNAAGERPAIEDRADWYAIYKTQDVATRPPMRTYTIRHLRAEAGEVDIDFVLHGETGPASRWALNAEPGDRVQITAPNAAFEGEVGGYEWKPPAELSRVLLIADETALPALAGILEDLAAREAPPATQAFVEIPHADDALPVATWPGLEVEWMPRGRDAHGARMIEALVRARTPVLATAGEAVGEIDIEAVLPWERATGGADGFYAWVAGESAAVMVIRRELVQQRGLDRRAINLMGYWREGRVLD
ncbi:MAG: siderophore-interacting protein [Caulobacteraceae bacterium]|nr:siderophore-interacting protein [Caulobacteraceae bacterium]